jgi:hypothetical protein
VMSFVAAAVNGLSPASRHVIRRDRRADGGSVFCVRCGGVRTEKVRGPIPDEERTDAVQVCGDTDGNTQRRHKLQGLT